MSYNRWRIRIPLAVNFRVDPGSIHVDNTARVVEITAAIDETAAITEGYPANTAPFTTTLLPSTQGGDGIWRVMPISAHYWSPPGPPFFENLRPPTAAPIGQLCWTHEPQQSEEHPP